MFRGSARSFPLVTLVREPLVRFVASYKDKIERYGGEEYYYKLITAKILGTKYPRSMLPSSQTEWFEKRDELGLKLSFLNMVEWNLKLKCNVTCGAMIRHLLSYIK